MADLGRLNLPRLMVAGSHSGVGKTTVTVGLLQALSQSRWTVQPFKVGPDYIDPGYLTAVAGRPCRNLDGWLIPHQKLPHLFAQASRGAQIGLVEGMMGLYDGIDATGEKGSSAEMAKLLGCPVLLVIDASAVSRSAAAMVKGFLEFDRKVKIAGCFVNRVAGPSHYRLVKQAVERLTGVPVIGFLPWDERLRIPERHLGLLPETECREWRKILPLLARRMKEGLDLPAFQKIARQAKPLSFPQIGSDLEVVRSKNGACRVPIAVAQDEAFHFYYRENLELLEQNGAQIVPFSPLKDSRLPGKIGALYLGGGFPEMYAADLAGNRPMKRQMLRACAAGMPVYAECGGLMVLSRSIRTSGGRSYPMVGAIPADVRMTGRLQNFGYQKVRAAKSHLLGRAGESARGHEFHHSALKEPPSGRWAAYRIQDRRSAVTRPEGYARGSLLASYVHLHFWSQPRWAGRFVSAARAYVNRKADVMLGSPLKSGAAPQL